MAVLSLGLFIATAGMWIRSYWRTDAFDVGVTLERQSDGTVLWRHFKIWSSRGGLIARWERHWCTAALPKRKAFDWITAEPGTYYDNRNSWEGLYLFRAVAGLCPVCGYDLRATPDRCPECGAASPEPPPNPPVQRTGTAKSGAVV
jgi:hypothetical protein